MNQVLRKIIDKAFPKINPQIGNGIACTQLPYVEEYVDAAWRAVARTWPETIRYKGGKRCTPKKAFEQLTHIKDNKRSFDVARSDLYLMEYTFEVIATDPERPDRVTTTELHRYVLLPFCRDAGEIFISGARYFIAPIIADKVISKGTKDVFVRLIRALLTFEQFTHDFSILAPNDRCQWLRHLGYVTWSKIHNNKNAGKKVKTTLPHYLFCKYGITEAFQKFTNTTPVIGTDEEVNSQTHNPEEWVITRSTGSRTVGKRTLPVHTSVRLAVRREDFESNELLHRLITGFWYVVDNYPERVIADVERLNSTRTWKIMLGHMTYDDNEHDGQLADKMDEHIQSLDEYVDEIMKKRFERIGYNITDAYQMFALIETNMSLWLFEGSQTINSLYGKELNNLNFLLKGTVQSINNFNFALKAKLASRKDSSELNAKEVQTIMDKHVKPGRIYSISRDNAEITPGSVPGDNMAFKTTTVMLPQPFSSKSARRNTGSTGPEVLLHVSVAEHAGYGCMPKKYPDGRARVNLYAKTAPDGSLEKEPSLQPILERVQQMITLESGNKA